MSDFSNKNRIACERRIVERVVDDVLRAGYCLTVHDGEDNVLLRSTDRTAILAAMFSTDEDYLFVIKPGAGNIPALRVGWVRFIYGNDGPDVIADYTNSKLMNDLLKGATDLADLIDQNGLACEYPTCKCIVSTSTSKPIPTCPRSGRAS